MNENIVHQGEAIMTFLMEKEREALADILKKYFGCKKPFLKTPKYIGEDSDFRDYMTVQGGEAYGKLAGIIYDLEELCPEVNANEIMDRLDMIVEVAQL